MSLAAEFRRCWLIATLGCILFSIGGAILFWNEGRAVHNILSLDEAEKDAITVNAEADFEEHYEGRLVHVKGPILIGEPLTEPDYNIVVMAVKLKRRVQMYQWVEETVEQFRGQSPIVEEAGDRTYYYYREWKDQLVDSRQFYIQSGHQNPSHFPLESQTQVAEVVTIGRYELGGEAKNRFSKFVELTSDARPEDSSIKLHLGLYYHSNDIFEPEVGDIRILFSFSGMEGEVYTVVGQLEKGKIVPYETSRGSKILLVYSGELSLRDVFKAEHHVQRLTTWGFRFIGWVLIFFGATCTTILLHILLLRIPFLSVLAPDPGYPVSANLILSFSLALAVTSIAWIFHRPWVGAGLLLAAASPFLYCARGFIAYERMS